MLESIKQPEYTGENRCPPCTIVNVVIAALASAVPIAVGVPGGIWTAVASGAVLSASLAAIYLRGYLVPGTPTLTKRYLPESVLALFGKAPDPASAGALRVDAADGERADAGDPGDGGDTGAPGDGSPGSDEASPDVDASPEAFLQAVGALEPCEGGSDLCLTDGFESAWNDEIAVVREAGVSAETITRRLDAPKDEYTIEERRDAWVLTNSSYRVGQWPSRAALIADAAAAAALESWTDRWKALSPRERSTVVAGLRLFLEDCPTADGGVSLGEDTVESCCRQRTVVTLTCEETGERLLEVPAPEAA